MASRDNFPVIGVGASAGGLEALRETLSGFEDSPGMTLVVVQHLDPNHESMMAQLIERYTSMPVRQIEGGERLEMDHVYVIPPGHGLSVTDGVLNLVDFEMPRGLRRPIDDFFESLAEDRGPLAACVILSGTGADGSRGLRAIKEHGGLTIAQDPQDARYDGMPTSAVGTGLVDFIVSAREILPTLRTYFQRRENDDPAVIEAEFVADHIDDLCSILRSTIGHDFSAYKRSTLTRRIQRRMQVLGIDSGREYVQRARHDRQECQSLFSDLLINVTRFFRDADAFEMLRAHVIEPLIEDAEPEDEIRMWVPGCSSGEEAYTIAMLCRHEMDRQGKRPIVSIFASDIDEGMLQLAREGRYPVAALIDIPEPMRNAYTVGHGDNFTVTPAVRDMVRFSSHSVIKDPPFSKIDLISCRNLLIYFEDRLQQSVMPLFHYALRPGGFLFLGPSETIGRFDDLFDPLDQRARLFRRRDVRTSYPLELPSTPKRTVHRPRPASERSDYSPAWLEGEALRQMTQSYGPASMLVDGQGMLIANWGPVGRYYDFPSDRERRIYVPTLAKSGLREVLGGLIRETATEGGRHVARDIAVQADFGTQQVNVICEPVRDGTYLVVIRESADFRPKELDDAVSLDAGDRQLRLLEEELRVTRHRLRSTVEELETANEELKSSNEEMMSMNEELQSTNEELTTVNDELKTKLDQLTVANSDLKNFFDSTQLAVVVVDPDLVIRSFTDAACDIFPFKPGDRGRALSDMTTPLVGADYVEIARRVARTGQQVETRILYPAQDRIFALNAMPYRRLDGSLDGATLVFTDISKPLELERQLAVQRERLELAIEVAGIGIWEYDPITGIAMLDAKERELLNVEAPEASDIEQILRRVHEEDRPRVNEGLRRAMDGTTLYDETFRVVLSEEAVRWVHGLGKRIRLDERDARFIGVSYDVSAEHEAIAQRDLLLREMNHRIKNLFSVVGAMIAIARREADDVGSFADDLGNRVEAMNRAHTLTQKLDNEAPALLRDLVEAVLAPARGGQPVTISGPDLEIPVAMLTPFALILHEWATNSAKYGALSFAEGGLDVSWSCDESETCLVWAEQIREFSGSSVKGFGTRLVEASVRQLGARLSGSQSQNSFVRRLTLSGMQPPRKQPDADA